MDTGRKLSFSAKLRLRINHLRNTRRSLRLSRIVATPARPIPLESFGFYALVMTRDEEEVIADSIANAFAQGADRVLLIDHRSTDATVERAVHNGAELVASFDHETFHEMARIDLMNAVVDEVSSNSEHDHIWWLWFDADEFPRPAQGGTIRQTLEQLDREVRLVGARSINHYPTPGQPEYVPGVHPASYQLMAHEQDIWFCRKHHRKHPLQRWDRGAVPLQALSGFHSVSCAAGPIPEADLDLVIHHIQWRNRAATERRLAMDGRAKIGSYQRNYTERLASIDAIYTYDWAKVMNHHPLRSKPGIEVIDWREMTPQISPELPTWTLRDQGPSITD